MDSAEGTCAQMQTGQDPGTVSSAMVGGSAATTCSPSTPRWVEGGKLYPARAPPLLAELRSLDSHTPLHWDPSPLLCDLGQVTPSQGPPRLSLVCVKPELPICSGAKIFCLGGPALGYLHPMSPLPCSFQGSNRPSGQRPELPSGRHSTLCVLPAARGCQFFHS